jgi:hypothetical protein
MFTCVIISAWIYARSCIFTPVQCYSLLLVLTGSSELQKASPQDCIPFTQIKKREREIVCESFGFVAHFYETVERSLLPLFLPFRRSP